jgi:molecular chaperone GrpE
MAEKKRVEPEIGFPDRNGGGDGRPGTQPGDGQGGSEVSRVSVHDLVPGLEDEIARQQGGEAELGAQAERIATLEAELAELRDKWTRALAEAENVRRRAERDRRDAEAYGGTRLARDMLSVWDNLERAMKAADDALRNQHGPFLEGVELTQRELLNAFGKHRIEKVTPHKGEKFDPNRHQAMFEAPVPGAEPGTVVEVLQDGFVIADRLLRPALVGVASAASAPPPAADPAAGSGPGGQDGPGDQGGGTVH